MALLVGGSSLAGGLANTEKARTSTSSSTSSGTSGTSSRKFVTPEQQAVQSPLVQQILQRLNNPAAGLEPFHTSAREGVNSTYAGMEDIVRQKYGTSAGKSGKMGRAAREGESSRLGALSGLEGQFAQMAAGRQDQAMGMGQQFLSQNFGQDSSASSSGSQQGSSVMPGSVGAGALTGGLQMFASLMALQSLMGGEG